VQVKPQEAAPPSTKPPLVIETSAEKEKESELEVEAPAPKKKAEIGKLTKENLD
jgi:hypothetical protein